MNPDKFRTGLLISLLGGVFFVLGQSIFNPNQPKTSATPFVFPDAIALPGWKLSSRRSLNDHSIHRNFIAGKFYQYSKNQSVVDVEIRYFVDTDGDVEHYLQSYQKSFFSDRSSIRHHPETGFYQVFSDQNKAYLSACINPQGGSTVTGIQFRNNRNAYDLSVDRIAPWLLGRSNLRDFRCLWTHLSTPLKDSPEKTYSTLESAWIAWYSSWRPPGNSKKSRFPQE
ncbi:cyanoexosortase A system-associated protein [Phormidesmis priestleyi]